MRVSDHATDGRADFSGGGQASSAGLLAAIAGVGCGFTANLLMSQPTCCCRGSAQKLRLRSIANARQCN